MHDQSCQVYPTDHEDGLGHLSQADVFASVAQLALLVGREIVDTPRAFGCVPRCHPWPHFLYVRYVSKCLCRYTRTILTCRSPAIGRRSAQHVCDLG